jgi:hypothetical protein
MKKIKQLTQEQIARKAGISQPAVAKKFAKFCAEGAAMDMSNQTPEYRKSAAKLIAEKARAAKRENDLAEGKLHRNDECERGKREAGQMIRTSMQNAGNELAPFLANVSPREAKRILDDWGDRTLTAWADWAKGHEIGK